MQWSGLGFGCAFRVSSVFCLTLRIVQLSGRFELLTRQMEMQSDALPGL